LGIIFVGHFFLLGNKNKKSQSIRLAGF